MADYSTWPTAADVSAHLEAAGVTLRSGVETRVSDLLSAVVTELERETRQQFVADVEPTIRAFDGTDTAALDVDPFVEVSGSSVGGVYAKTEQGKPKTRLYIQSGVGAGAFGVASGLGGVFPAGRQNIVVTARWGFADAIPADVWEAVCGEAALRAAGEALFSVHTSDSGATGFIIEEKFGDESVKYAQASGDKAGQMTGWHGAFEKACKAYKRSQYSARKKLRGPML